MKIFVAGGTGAIGRHAVNALHRAGHELTVIARSAENAQALAARGIQTGNVSIFDREALTKSFRGIDVVVNLTSSIPPMWKFMIPRAWEANNKVRTEGAAAISGAAMDAGVSRLIQESVCMLYPDGGSEWLDESTPTDRYPMAEANLAAEAAVERFASSGRIGIVLRFGWFYGPGATHSEQFLKMARFHFCVQMGKPNTYVSSIFMPDAGAAVVSVLDAPPGTYNVVDDTPLTKKEYADALGTAAGVNWWVRLPGSAALLLGDRSTSLTRSIRASNKKLKRLTDWRPLFPSAREGWEELARLHGC